MAKRTGTTTRQGESREALSRERIIAASIALLDSVGENGLTFRALSERLATGPGAIYWHISDKSDLLRAACDALITSEINPSAAATPQETIRAVALRLFDVIDEHPWVGSALTTTPGELPMVRILERIGQQVSALGIPAEQRWAAVSALMAYMLGVSKQNAANANLARTQNLDRSAVLNDVAAAWSELPLEAYPFTRSMAGRLRDHDDRNDFLAGIDLILRGIEFPRRPSPSPRKLASRRG